MKSAPLVGHLAVAVAQHLAPPQLWYDRDPPWQPDQAEAVNGPPRLAG